MLQRKYEEQPIARSCKKNYQKMSDWEYQTYWPVYPQQNGYTQPDDRTWMSIPGFRIKRLDFIEQANPPIYRDYPDYPRGKYPAPKWYIAGYTSDWNPYMNGYNKWGKKVGGPQYNQQGRRVVPAQYRSLDMSVAGPAYGSECGKVLKPTGQSSCNRCGCPGKRGSRYQAPPQISPTTGCYCGRKVFYLGDRRY